MARINSNVAAISAQRVLGHSYKQLNETLERLSTGLRINHGKDDPAGLIVSEQLRSETSAVGQAIRNSQRASNIIATAEGSLDEVASLLRSMNEKIIEAANTGAMSDAEIEANQLQIDSAIESITRIANTTTFAGRRLLDGSLDYVTSGVDMNAVRSLQIHGASFGTLGHIPIDVEVTQSAQPATAFFPQAGAGASAITIEIRGNLGATTVSFAPSATAADMVQGINQISDATGVEAILSSNPTSGFRLESDHLGQRQFLQVTTLPGSDAFTLNDSGGSPVSSIIRGRDATATVNGAMTVGDGNHLALKTSTLDMELTLDETFGSGGVWNTSFAITDGGANFQIGPRVNTALQVPVGIQSIAASRLGNALTGFLSQIKSDGEYALTKGEGQRASQIVDEAIKQVSVLRGRLGAFEKNVLETNMNQLAITQQNLMASESTVRDADFAYETSQLSRNQVLVQSGTRMLGIANQVPQNVLALLG
jgi:flagellin